VWCSSNQRRAFVYVVDVVNALISVLQRGMVEGVVQIGPDKNISIREIAELIVKISRKTILIKFNTSKMEGDVDRSADWSKAKKIHDW